LIYFAYSLIGFSAYSDSVRFQVYLI